VALHPQARAAVEAYAEEQPVYDPAFDIVASRTAARALAASDLREPVDAVTDVDAEGVACRLYRPEGADGLVVHLHGGGFVFHDLETHDAAARRLANRTGMAVLSVGYRCAPEHPFPAARDDVDTVLGWLEREAPGLGLDVPTYVHGDSAGANLALVAALRHPGRFAAVALLYPFLDPSAGFDSYRTAADGFDASEAAWYWDQYADPADRTDPDVAPLLSDRLGTLPPTLVVTAEHDPLRDEGEELVRRLAEEGAAVTGTRYLGQVHGFWRQPELFDAAEPLGRHVADFLRRHLG
jgi:acetyl esterase